MKDLSDIDRVNKELMPHQTLMELLVEYFVDKKAFRDKDGNFEDIATGTDVHVIENTKVVSIEWEADDGGFHSVFGPVEPRVSRKSGNPYVTA